MIFLLSHPNSIAMDPVDPEHLLKATLPLAVAVSKAWQKNKSSTHYE